MKIYISGPITKDPNAKERFYKTQKRLENWCMVDVINVFNIPRHKELEENGGQWLDYMKIDIAELTKADFIYMLYGWRKSRGAKIERKIAKMLNIPVMYETRKIARAVKNGIL